MPCILCTHMSTELMEQKNTAYLEKVPHTRERMIAIKKVNDENEKARITLEIIFVYRGYL